MSTLPPPTFVRRVKLAFDYIATEKESASLKTFIETKVSTLPDIVRGNLGENEVSVFSLTHVVGCLGGGDEV